MKKYITLGLICISILGNTQIGQKVETKKSVLVGKVAPLGAFKEELSYVEDVESLYNDMKGQFDKEVGQSYDFKLTFHIIIK